MKSFNGSARALVDMTGGEISRELFVNDDIYHEEQERVFARAWLFIGHESQVPKAGDFVLSKMGEESVILVRDRHDKLHVFLNTCRHRGMKVCRYDEGNTKVFTCPYHAWSYGTDGKLVGVQDFKDAYAGGFNRDDWGLVEVAHMANFRGTIWATWDRNAPAFEDYLGDARFGLENAICPWDGGDGEVELLGSTQRWIIPSNWKFVAENFAGDVAHGISHRSVDLAGIFPGADGEGRRDDPGQLILSTYPGGHGVVYGKRSTTARRDDYAISPVTAAYFKSQWEKRVARQGEAATLLPIVGTVFPNTSYHGQQPRTILIAHPRGAQVTEMWRIYLVDKKAPEEAKAFLRDYYIRYSGPAGLTEQDDMENWNYATSASEGVIARKFPYLYKAGLHAGGPNALIPGRVTEHPVTSEQNSRGIYDSWARFMDNASWDSILAATEARQ